MNINKYLLVIYLASLIGCSDKEVDSRSLAAGESYASLDCAVSKDNCIASAMANAKKSESFSFEAKQTGNSIQLTWNEIEGANEYFVALTKDSQCTEIVQSHLNITNPRYEVTVENPGSYYICVFVVTGSSNLVKAGNSGNTLITVESKDNTSSKASETTPSIEPIDAWLKMAAVVTRNPKSLGESVTVLGPSEGWIDEWMKHSVEIWVKLSGDSAQEQINFETTMTYNSQIFSVLDAPMADSSSYITDIDEVNGTVKVHIKIDLRNFDKNQYYLAGVVNLGFKEGDIGVPIYPDRKPKPINTSYAFTGSKILIGEPEEAFSIGLDSIAMPVWPVIYDVNDSGAIDYRDLILFTGKYNKSAAATDDYTLTLDFNGDGSVNYTDLVAISNELDKSALDLVWEPSYPTNFPSYWQSE